MAKNGRRACAQHAASKRDKEVQTSLGGPPSATKPMQPPTIAFDARLMLIAVFALVVVGFGSSSMATRHGRSRYTPPPPADLYCLQGPIWVIRVKQRMSAASGTFAHCDIWAFRG
jgi:hypothetical protein